MNNPMNIRHIEFVIEKNVVKKTQRTDGLAGKL